MTAVQHVFLTGVPGIGKTTLVQNVCKELQSKNIALKGFYTAELREGGRRVGFNVISLDGKVGSLARIGEGQGPRVGNYVVQVQSFESVALPVLQLHQGTSVVTVVDEIGKMELFSKCFETAVKRAFASDSIIFGTIPMPKGKPLPLVEFIRSNPSVKIITVDYKNRDKLLEEVVTLLLSVMKRSKEN